MNSRCKKRRNNEFGWRECQAKACLGQECRNCSVIFWQEHHDPAFIMTARRLYWPSTLQKKRGGFRCIIFLQVCVKCQKSPLFSPLPLLLIPPSSSTLSSLAFSFFLPCLRHVAPRLPRSKVLCQFLRLLFASWMKAQPGGGAEATSARRSQCLVSTVWMRWVPIQACAGSCKSLHYTVIY